jgi:hypothetical protein
MSYLEFEAGGEQNVDFSLLNQIGRQKLKQKLFYINH